MNIKELRTKNLMELKEELVKAKNELKTARIAFAQKKEKNIKKPLLLRKTVAKLLTVMHEKQIIAEVKNA